MRLLDALGVPTAAESKVSFEHRKASMESFDAAWLRTLQGQAVKLLEPQHRELPPELPYDFIWCSRNPAEQARSQIKLLRLFLGLQLGTEAHASRMAKGIIDDTPRVQKLLRSFPDHRWLEMHFEETLARPSEATAKLANFLGLNDELAKFGASCQVVKRSPKCYAGMLEMQFLDQEPST